MSLTLGIEIFGWLCVAAGFVLIRQPGGLAAGGCGAVILGMAYAGAFQI